MTTQSAVDHQPKASDVLTWNRWHLEEATNCLVLGNGETAIDIPLDRLQTDDDLVRWVEQLGSKQEEWVTAEDLDALRRAYDDLREQDEGLDQTALPR